MNTSSLTGLVVILAAGIWLGFFVPAWVKRGERVQLVREATRQIKQQAKALRPKRGEKRQAKRVQVQEVAQRVDYRALYQAALAVGGVTEGAPAGVASADEGGWMPRHMPAPLHTGHVGTLEQPTLASVTSLTPAAVLPAIVAHPEEAVIGLNLDEILRRRRAV